MVNEIEGDINASRYALSSYNEMVEASAMELKHKVEKEKESLIAKAQVSRNEYYMSTFSNYQNTNC